MEDGTPTCGHRAKTDNFVRRLGISYRQFSMWLNTLRLYVPDEISAEERARDPAYKIRHYLTLVERGAQAAYTPQMENLSIDEEMSGL